MYQRFEEKPGKSRYGDEQNRRYHHLAPQLPPELAERSQGDECVGHADARILPGQIP